jgi:hypothetical protein
MFLSVSASGASPGDLVAGEELAVVQAMAATLNREAERPYDFLFFKSDFTAIRQVASSMASPDRTDFCGLTREEGQALVLQLRHANTDPVEFDKEIAREAGLKIGHKKMDKFRYLMLSRVVFDPTKLHAWIAVNLNGTTGAVMRLDKVDGDWTQASRCAGWLRAG